MKKSIPTLAATVGTAILFPGFLIYHTVLGIFSVSPFFGGYFGPISLLVGMTTLLAVFFTKLNEPRLVNYAVIGSLSFLAFASAWTLGWQANSNSYYIAEAATQSWESLALIAALFLLGRYVDINHKLIRTGFAIFAIIIFVFLTGNFLLTGNINFNARSQFGTEDIASYQGFATSTMIIGTLAIAGQSSLVYRFGFIALISASLFMIGSRSEAIAFVFGAAVYAATIAVRSPRTFMLLMFFTSIIFSAFFINLDFISESRFTELSDLSSSTSFIARSNLQEFAVSQIIDSPILGNFGGHFILDGRGAYSHSIISAWVSFGIFGFSFYAALNLFPFFVSIQQNFRNKEAESIWNATLIISCIVLLLSLFAKSVFWEVPGLLWGLFSQATLSKRALDNNAQLKTDRDSISFA